MDLTSKILKSSLALRVFSSEVGTGSREENASKQKRDRAFSVLIQSELRRLWNKKKRE
jgi:hypothetical protein